MTDAETTNPFETFTAHGYRRLVPVIPPTAELSPNSSLAKRKDARGKAVGVKGRDGLWRGLDWIHHEADADDLDRWHRMGAGVGIKTGEGLLAIDADTLDAGHARTIRDIVEEAFGRLPVRIGRYPKALYVIRCDQPYPYTRVEFGETERVEVLSDMRQFVAHGIHPVTNADYHWPRGVTPFEELPTTTPAELDALMARIQAALPAAKPVVKEGATNSTPVNPESLRGDPATIRQAVAATPNTNEHFGSREEYLAYGYAIKAALPDDEPTAFDIFADWCGRWDGGENNLDIVAADWRRMKPPFRRGAGYIYDTAERHGTFSTAQLWFQPPDETAPIFDLPASQPAKKFIFTHFNDAAARAFDDVSRPLIDGLLELSAMSVLYGDSNVGKTFVALGMAHAIATGQHYGDLPTKHARVAYIAAEGGRGIRKRIAALKAAIPTADEPDFFLLVSPVDLRRPDADLKPLVEALTDLNPAFIVLDTLSRVMAGGDENSSVDMGALVKHFDALRAATDAHLMVIHHTGKDKAKGARGHSLLRAATDTEIEVTEGVVSVTKQRDLEKDWQTGFRLESVVLGVDAADRPVSSARVVLETVAAGPGKGNSAAVRMPLTKQEQRIIEAIERVADEHGEVSADDVADAIPDIQSDGGKAKVRFHLRNLTLKGWLQKSKRGKWSLEVKETVPSLQKNGHFVHDAETEVEESEGQSGVNIFE
jgi:hypothetical protein